MEENLKVDKDYKEAFNLGYELAQELNLKSPMFTDINSSNGRMHAMQAGMAEYSKETIFENTKEISRSLGSDRNKNASKDLKSNNNIDKGADLSI